MTKAIHKPEPVQTRLHTLRETIRRHEHLYYVLDAPEIDDLDFDRLMRELKALEAEHPDLITPDSPTQRVGGKPKDGFAKVEHSRPMLSLDNVNTPEELADWDRRVRSLAGSADVSYVTELKLDGLSLALHYGPSESSNDHDAHLLRALTRGDGTIGEDVTSNVRTIRSVPLSIPAAQLKKAHLPRSFEVRGEVVMPMTAFLKMNEEREAAGKSPAANPRNAAAGVIRTVEPNIVAQRRLDFYGYFALQLPDAEKPRRQTRRKIFLPSRPPRSTPSPRPASASTRIAKHCTLSTNCRPSSPAPKLTAASSAMRSMASSLKSMRPHCSVASATPAALLAGPSLTSSPPALPSRRWKTSSSR